MGDQRRSPRHLLGTSAEIHIGPKTVVGVVQDVSQHGMGITVPSEVEVSTGDVIWVLAQDVATFAITGTVRRSAPGGKIGIEFEEILSGDTLERVKEFPLDELSAAPTGVSTELKAPNFDLSERDTLPPPIQTEDAPRWASDDVTLRPDDDTDVTPRSNEDTNPQPD